MMLTIKLIELLLLCVLQISDVLSATYEANWASIESRPLPQWFDNSKIGIFLHWGIYSVPSFDSEWFWINWKHNRKGYANFMHNNFKPNFTYQEFAPQFTAEFYDPNHWAEIFNASGAKYIVLTSKHHEGYTLWPSKYSWNWNVMDVGPKRDLLGELAEAVRSAGLRFGVYHSLLEWFHPLYLQDMKNEWKTQEFVNNKIIPEMKELVESYKPDLFFSDGEIQAPSEYWKATEFLAWLYNESPVKDKIVVNDRWGNGTMCTHGGYYSCHDRYNPKVLQTHKWEQAMTIDKHTWGYRRTAQLSDYLTTDQLITTVVETISCNGNILINVGPTHDGRIIPIFEERLRELGHWLSINGEAIYESRPWIYQNDTLTENVWYTKGAEYVYAIVLDWPIQYEVALGSVETKTVKNIQLVGHNGDLKFVESNNEGTVVSLPTLSPETSLKWAWVLRITLNK